MGVHLIDRVGRRRLLLIGAIGMSVCEFIVAIVGVTAGNINPVTQAVNTKAQKVLVTFVMMFVFLLSNFVTSGSLTLGSLSFLCLFIDIFVSSLLLGDLLYGLSLEKSS